MRKLLCFKILISAALTILAFSCNRLPKNGIAKINFELYGCFGSEQSELTIYKSGGVQKARLDTKGVGEVEAIVDKDGEKAFEIFLRSIKAADRTTGCTTQQHCSVYTQIETLEKKNIDCSWQGFNELKTALFKQD